ncbi:MAG: alpha-amylase family glycosyl hydrolase [Caldilineales bacterium]
MLDYPRWLPGCHHDGSAAFVSSQYPQLGETITLRLRTPADAPLRRVAVRTLPDGEQAFHLMQAETPDGAVRWWRAELPVSQPLLHYRFALEAADGVWWLHAGGVSAADPLDATDFRIVADYHAPHWLREAVFYQIFPDRFANGDPDNDPHPADYDYAGHQPHTYAWGSPPPADAFFPLVFYGGDLQGIADHLDYVEYLGVNALYLTPVFSAPSNHKYDVADYEAVDRHFGGDAALAALRAALTRRGMRYVLDIVPNHCGVNHRWFQTARSDATSAEAAFFTFQRHPDRYESWLGVASLPKLNFNSSELRRRLYENADAVFRRWLRAPFGADGWRVDVANMLGRQGASQLGQAVAHGIRAAVKQTEPDAYLLGENFFDASTQLQGDQFDGMMNYSGFTRPLRHWLQGYHQGAWGMKEPLVSPVPFSSAALVESWRSRLAAIPWVIALQQFNLLDSHDTERILTQVKGNAALQQLAAAVLLTFPGVPCIYYGDEIGLADSAGLGSRGCMEWDESRWNRQTLTVYRRLIALRRQSHALQQGSFEIVAVEADSVAFLRRAGDELVLVVAHRGETARPAKELALARYGIADGVVFEELFSGQQAQTQKGSLLLPQQPQGATVWRS